MIDEIETISNLKNYFFM